MDTPTNESERESPRKRGWTALIVALVAAAPFVRSLGYPFLTWDDDVNFLGVEHVRSLDLESLRWMWTSFHAGHYAPLTWMSCALDFELAPGDPAAQMHRTNLALHAATAAALFAALAQLLTLCARGARSSTVTFAAALGTLVWAVHPLRTESVAWLTERRDVLSGLFYALALAGWLRSKGAAPRRRLWLALALLAFAAALLSKVSGVGLPLALVALERWALRAPRVAWLEKLPWFTLAGAASIVAVLGQRESTQVLASAAELGVLQRIAVAAHAACFYVVKTLAPFGLSPFYELPERVSPLEPRFAGAIAAALVAFTALFALRNRSRLHATLWTAAFTFAVLLAPVSGLMHAGRQIAADRYTYLPSFAVAGLAAAAVLRFDSRALRVTGAVLVLALGAQAWRMTGRWRDTITLFERAVDVEPHGYWANHKLGVLYHQVGEFEAALRCYDRAIDARKERGAAFAWYDRAVTRLALGQMESARADLEAALDHDPAHVGALRALFDLERAAGRPRQILERLENAARAAPSSLELLSLAASTRLALEDNEGALAAASKLAELAPDDPFAHGTAGMALLYLGRFAEAERELARACELEPTPQRHFNRGVALERLERWADARAAFEQVLRLEPANPRAKARLAALEGR